MAKRYTPTRGDFKGQTFPSHYAYRKYRESLSKTNIPQDYTTDPVFRRDYSRWLEAKRNKDQEASGWDRQQFIRQFEYYRRSLPTKGIRGRQVVAPGEKLRGVSRREHMERMLPYLIDLGYINEDDADNYLDAAGL